MAVLKVYAVRNQLKRAVNYAANEEKTSIDTLGNKKLDSIITYAANPKKTEQRLFESALNCQSVETSYSEMQRTKKKFGKEDEVLAYHYIQSFKPGEVTAEEAHQIGIEFAQKCFGDKFEIVIGTHLDRKHFHNHIVVNSVSFVDGKKLRSTPQAYYNLRKISDELCIKHGLSVIQNPKRKGKHYAEWKAEKENRPTIRGRIREELDEIINQSYTMKEFWRNLNREGYTIHRKGENIKHTSIIPPFGKRPVRLDSLGDMYTEEAIQNRIMKARNVKRIIPQAKRYRLKGSLQTSSRKRMKGFMALYFHYLYLFKKIRRNKAPKRVSFFMREELTKLNKYQKQFSFLYTHNIETAEQLNEYKRECENKMSRLSDIRKELHEERKAKNHEERKEENYEERKSENEENKEHISEINSELRKLRSDVRMCKAVFEVSENIAEKQRQIQELYEQEKIEKEAKQHEHRRRSR